MASAFAPEFNPRRHNIQTQTQGERQISHNDACRVEAPALLPAVLDKAFQGSCSKGLDRGGAKAHEEHEARRCAQCKNEVDHVQEHTLQVPDRLRQSALRVPEEQ